MAAANRVSTYTSTSTATDGRGEQKNLWTSMLGSVASGKRLPEKNVLVLGVWPPPSGLSLCSGPANISDQAARQSPSGSSSTPCPRATHDER